MPKYCPSCARIESNGEYCPSCGTKLVNQDAIGSSYVKNEINPDYEVISGRIEKLSIKYHSNVNQATYDSTPYTTIGNTYTFRVNNTDLTWGFSDIYAQDGDYVNVLLRSGKVIALHNATTNTCSPKVYAPSRTLFILVYGLIAAPSLFCTAAISDYFGTHISDVF